MKKLLALLLTLSFVSAAHAQSVQVQYVPNAIFKSGDAVTNRADLRAFANVAAAQTDSSIIAAVSGKKIRVTAVTAVAGGTATNLTFNSKGSGAGVAISPLFANGINGGEVLPFNPQGWFETVSGEALTVTTGAGSTTGILVTYVTY